MSRWKTGEADVTRLLANRDLEQVAASPANARRLLAEAARHLRSAEVLATDDPAGAYDMLYTAARESSRMEQLDPHSALETQRSSDGSRNDLECRDDRSH